MIKSLYKTIKSISGTEEGSTKLVIIFTDGSELRQFHEQDGYEYVAITQFDGNCQKHIGAEVYCIEEEINTNPEGYDDSATETFYTLVTTKGYLDWRWVGESNGYYSESVEMQFIGKFKDL